jgi:hypothetical protein
MLIRCRAAAAGRGRRLRSRGGAHKAERPAKTAADLDAEMEIRANTPNAYHVLIIRTTPPPTHPPLPPLLRLAVPFFFHTVVVVCCTSFFGLCCSPQFLKP